MLDARWHLWCRCPFILPTIALSTCARAHMHKDVAIEFLGIGVVCFNQPSLRSPSEINTNSFLTVLFARASLSRNYTHTRRRTCIHDAGRQVAPLVLLSIHPSYHRTEHMCTRRHACAHARSPGLPAVRTFPGHPLMTSLTTLKI